MKVEYTTNNSGGGWWLSDADWQALETSGWKIQWGRLDWCSKYRLKEENICPELGACPGHGRVESFEQVGEKNRFLGAAAVSATLDNVRSIEEAKRSWENSIWRSSDDEGCECCGPPHYFSEVYEPQKK